MLKKIINKYCIQQVGIGNAEIIISRDNFVSAVREISALGYLIASVDWFRHKKISEIDDKLDTISMGGPTDKNNKEYFWAETNFGSDFESNNLPENMKVVLNYYEDFAKNDKYDLYPAITIVANKN